MMLADEEEMLIMLVAQFEHRVLPGSRGIAHYNDDASLKVQSICAEKSDEESSQEAVTKCQRKAKADVKKNPNFLPVDSNDLTCIWTERDADTLLLASAQSSPSDASFNHSTRSP
jgi:hypothetical protein